MEEKENKIFVIYVGVAGVRSEDIKDFTKKITSKITPESVEGEFIIIPINSYETRIECINPTYITKKSLINKHTNLMTRLNEELQHQLNELRKDEKKD